ncbi:MAG TPA: hypothetical protein VMD09_16020 [Solirubrobacteraceae bacterium]|nr:hypothetical protein [Solirubrobacteraceae bacterium]
MPRWVMLLPVAAAAGAVVGGGVPGALAGRVQAASVPQTRPHVRPSVGGKRSKFELSFTLAQAPGRGSGETTSYRATVTVPAHARAACAPTQPGVVRTGRKGQVKAIRLNPPRRGWCRGRYRVTVFLQETQAAAGTQTTPPPPTQTVPPPTQTQPCGPPLTMAQAAVVCPGAAAEAAAGSTTQKINTGQAYFRVR